MKLKYYFIFTEIINNKYKCTCKCVCVCVIGSYAQGLKMLSTKTQAQEITLRMIG